MLEGKTVLVSGGTGYLGTAICKKSREYGARVLFTYNKEEDKALRLEAELGEARAIRLDLRNPGDIQRTVAALYAEEPRIDILVNNAAIAQIMPLPLVEEEDFDTVFAINVKGTFFLTQQVVKGMVRNRGGAIVNIGSIGAARMLDVPATYAMSKSALVGFTTSLAAELKRFHIRVNMVVPGLLAEGVGQGVPSDLARDFVEHCTAGRPGQAHEIAEVVCFLASDRASYINGQQYAVDGGI